MSTPTIKRCSIAVSYESGSGLSSNETFEGDGHHSMLAAFRELGRVLCIAGHGIAVLEMAADVKAAVARDLGRND